jgi:hypothetical protein
MNEPQFWIAVASLDHVEQGVAGGYVEINHGKAAPLERMRAGDGIACYSPRVSYPEGPPLQAFTALGRVGDTPIVQSPLAHQPFRRTVAWLPCVHAPIRPLLGELGFVPGPPHWGAAFRFGFLRVGRDDFLRIAQAMQCVFVLPCATQALPEGAAPPPRRPRGPRRTPRLSPGAPPGAGAPVVPADEASP